MVDCVEYMKSLPDKAFKFAVVDPEYRDENQPDIHMRKKGGLVDWRGAPKGDYFEQLFRVSEHQLIWGGNYFTHFLEPNNNWLIWDKCIADGLHFSMCEMAWCSIRKNTKIFRYRPVNKTVEWHETSKPIALYKYIFKTYAQEGWNILDTNMGSQSSRIAAYFSGLDYEGCEIQKKYFDKGNSYFEEYKEKNRVFLELGIMEEDEEEKRQHSIFDQFTEVDNDFKL